MQVKVKLFATLRDYLPKESDGKSCMVAADENATIEALESLGETVFVIGELVESEGKPEVSYTHLKG